MSKKHKKPFYTEPPYFAHEQKHDKTFYADPLILLVIFCTSVHRRTRFYRVLYISILETRSVSNFGLLNTTIGYRETWLLCLLRQVGETRQTFALRSTAAGGSTWSGIHIA